MFSFYFLFCNKFPKKLLLFVSFQGLIGKRGIPGKSGPQGGKVTRCFPVINMNMSPFFFQREGPSRNPDTVVVTVYWERNETQGTREGVLSIFLVSLSDWYLFKLINRVPLSL